MDGRTRRGVYLHIAAEGAFDLIALRELTAMTATDGSGSGIVVRRDRRPVPDWRCAECFAAQPRGDGEELAETQQTATASRRVLRAVGLVREVTGRESFRALV
jgi:hypothetical protein